MPSFSLTSSVSGLVFAIVLSQTASAKWSITQLPASERAQACQEQVSFCYNACRSVENTAVNFCNIRTMGWNCACNGGSGDKRIKHYEWPVEVAECHAALSTCNGSCALKSNGNDRVACFTGCTSSYPCNTIEAPFSNLRVKSVYDKPAGYMPPLEDKDIELTIGMKFGADTPGMDDADKRAQKTNDPGRLPKIVPRSDDDDDDSVAKPGRGKGKNKGGNGSYRKGAHPGNADGGQLASGAVHATGQCANKVALLVAAAVAGVLSFA